MFNKSIVGMYFVEESRIPENPTHDYRPVHRTQPELLNQRTKKSAIYLLKMRKSLKVKLQKRKKHKDSNLAPPHPSSVD